LFLLAGMGLLAGPGCGATEQKAATPPPGDPAGPRVPPPTPATPLSSQAPGASVASMPSGPLRVIAGRQYDVLGLAADASHLYWTRRGDGAVRRVAIDGGAPEIIASGQNQPHAIAVVGPTVFWTNIGKWPNNTPAADGSLQQWVVGASTPTQLSSGLRGPLAFAVDDTHVYVALIYGAIYRVARADGKVAVFAKGQDSPRGIALDATHVYWTNLGRVGSGGALAVASGSVNRKKKTGGAPSVLADSQQTSADITVDGQHVYWLASGIVRRVAKTGGVVADLAASGIDSRESLRLVGDHLVYSHRGRVRAMPEPSAVLRVPKSGGNSELLLGAVPPGGPKLSKQGPSVHSEPCFEPSAIASNERFLFVADSGCGKVLRLDL
ncbi:MAG TPA: hypothetical protein PKA88_10365, partial [Polyangiaceae bacterium]|nr:hypothetical protein [Polyangiaceae bacterium]